MRPGQRSRHDRSGKGAVGLFHWHIQENRIASTPDLRFGAAGTPRRMHSISFADLRERIHPDDRELTIAALDEARWRRRRLRRRVSDRSLPDKSERLIGFSGNVAREPQVFVRQHMRGWCWM
jgi:hypothetical protein